jgi:uncharacterized protein (TIGR02996 family)
MSDEFLRSILDNPKDDATRLVYADWLEEHGEIDGGAQKSEYLRTTVRLATESLTKGKRKSLRRRLQELAAKLDTHWLGVVSRLPIENCYSKRKDRTHEFRFQFVCDRNWADMQPTPNDAVRFCDGCKQRVYYSDTIVEARKHAGKGHCVAVDLGVIRRDHDLGPPLHMMILGRMSPHDMDEEEPMDRVSAEREKRKKQPMA